MRCNGCNKIIIGDPITRKTCCINKLKNFCSNNCLQKWNQQWLKRQVSQNNKKKLIF
ncbi:MAG: hypothetical protein JXA99_10030 [Candidatus Lokiarchaeota archaeon]|nr:hypothetical protein [Candidatus Lokiarchaeota archaeon]